MKQKLESNYVCNKLIVLLNFINNWKIERIIFLNETQKIENDMKVKINIG